MFAYPHSSETATYHQPIPMNTEEYISLIQRNLKGELSPLEFDLLNAVTAKDTTMADLRLDIEDSWDMAGDDVVLVTKTDTQDLLNKIRSTNTIGSEHKGNVKSISNKTTVSKEVPAKSAKVFSLRRIVSSVAAVLICGLAAVWLLRDQVTTYDQAGTYTLADNTQVMLRAGSTLEVSPFDESQRRVALQGEAFFDVAKDANKPFRVVGKNVEIEVLGTSFLVKEVDGDTYIDLKEGKIKTVDTRSLSTEILTAGMQAHHSADGAIELTSGVSNLSSWRKGFYRYDNVTLGVALAELAIIFDTKISTSDPSLLDCNFSGNLAGESVDELLGRIAKIHKMEVKQDGSKWILLGGNCN